MKKALRKKICLIAVSLCMILTIVCQNVAFLSAEAPVKQQVVKFPEQPEQKDAEKTIKIPGLFEVTGITVDTGQVTYSIEGDDVTINVTDGEPTRIGPDTREITVMEYYDFNDFPDEFNYERDGYIGILQKTNSGYNEERGKYWAQYEGSVTKENCNFYSYEVTLSYTENVAPTIDIESPESGKVINSIMHVEAYVKDENIGDSLQIFYSIDVNNEEGTSLLDPITSTGTEQDVSKVIDVSSLELSENRHNIYFWVVDRKGAKSATIKIAFTVDRTPPEAPILIPDKTEPTNTSVTVSVYYPDDADKKEIKIGDGDWVLIEEVTDDDKIVVDENTIIEARATDEAGNESPIATLVIDNIDKTPPEAPTIKTSATETTGSSITATIEPGKDEGSGIDRTEYCLKGATEKEWTTYEPDSVIKITSKGETEICARSIDNAGNVSAIARKTVIIKSSSGGSGGSGGNNNPGNQDDNKDKDDNKNKDNDDDGKGDGKDITEPGKNVPAVGPVDLSIFVSADKSKYAEDDIITLELNYKNKSGISVSNVVVKAEIPPYTMPVETANGAISENYIEWKIDSLKANSSAKIQYTLKVDQLDKAEVNSSVMASITSDGTLINKEDDESKTIFLLYSDRYKDNFHKKYIVGYEDDTFRPFNNITRAEVATIMANVLDIKEGVSSSRVYTDLSESHWAYKNIMAVTEKGLFTGYLDGSFHPDSYITRAEFATVLANYLQLKNVEPERLNFSDISNHWAKNYIEEIYRIRLIEGYIEEGARLFKPDSNITRSEAVTIINKMLFRGPLYGAEVPFNDVEEGYWAYGHIVESSIDHYYTRNEDESETIVKKETEE